MDEYQDIEDIYSEYNALKIELAELQKERDELYKTSGLADLDERISKAKKWVEKAEGDYKTAYMKLYNITKDKHSHRGGEIRVFTVYKYDTDKAINWAKENNQDVFLNVSLNKKKFNAYVKSVEKPEFVTVKQIPRVSILTKAK